MFLRLMTKASGPKGTAGIGDVIEVSDKAVAKQLLDSHQARAVKGAAREQSVLKLDGKLEQATV